MSGLLLFLPGFEIQPRFLDGAPRSLWTGTGLLLTILVMIKYFSPEAPHRLKNRQGRTPNWGRFGEGFPQVKA